MRWPFAFIAAVTFAGAASARATLERTFQMSPEEWRSRCPAIATYDALVARGLRMFPIEFRPAYTRYSAKPLGGIVNFEVRIDTGGIVRDLHLVDAQLPALVAPALHAASRWRFKPIVVDGTPTCVEGGLEVEVLPYAPQRRHPDGRSLFGPSPSIPQFPYNQGPRP